MYLMKSENLKTEKVSMKWVNFCCVEKRPKQKPAYLM